MHPYVGLIAVVKEVDDDHVMLLTVAVTAADALFDPLRVPRQVIVDDLRAELKIHASGRSFGGDQRCHCDTVESSLRSRQEDLP